MNTNYYNIRVVLHGAVAPEIYVRLAKAMRAKGADDKITATSGQTYLLPPGEYQCSGNANGATVLENARVVVAQVWNRFSLRVTGDDGTWFIGLEPVKMTRPTNFEIFSPPYPTAPLPWLAPSVVPKLPWMLPSPLSR